MLSMMRLSENSAHIAPCQPKPDLRWDRNQKEDVKTAIDLLYKFKEELDKLHPECTMIIEKMLQWNR